MFLDDFSDGGFDSDDSYSGRLFRGRSGSGLFRGRSGGGLRCFECGGPHRKANCPNIRCFKCNGKGHMARDCPRGSSLALFAPPPRPFPAPARGVGGLLQALAGLSLGAHTSTGPLGEHDFPKDLKLFHGTIMPLERKIEAEGFKVSAAGQLGPGVYLVGESNVDKARRFAHDYALRDDRRLEEVMRGSAEPALVECIVRITRPKFLSGNDELGSWKLRGYDAARSDSTAMSLSSEWCLKDPSMVKRIVRVTSLAGEVCPWRGKQQGCPYASSAKAGLLACPCRGAGA